MSDQPLGSADSKPDLALDALLRSLKETEPAHATLNCPDPRRWSELAAGIASDSEKLLLHAAECGYCAPQLKQEIAFFAEESTPEAGLVTGERFGKVVAREQSQSGGRTGGQWMRRWLPIAAVLAVGILLAWQFVWPRFALQKANALMAQAESSARFSSYRFSGAPYAPNRVTRGISTDVPVLVLDAQQWASRAGSAPDAKVLRARIAIAMGDAARAPEAIEDVLKERGPSAKLLNDLAVALAARAERNRDDASARRALKAADQALALQPDFREALFNRILILSLLNQPDQACAALAAYRSLEQDSRWSEEASARITCEK